MLEFVGSRVNNFIGAQMYSSGYWSMHNAKNSSQDARDATYRITFDALMNALSHPGRFFDLPSGDPFAHIADALLDLETSYYTPDEKLAAQLVRTGAYAAPPEQASYHFYPHAINFDAVSAARTGEIDNPDTAAVLLIKCEYEGSLLELSGPDIAGTVQLELNLPSEFWALRERVAHPLGWDVLLTDGQRIVGLPRTACVSVLSMEEHPSAGVQPQTDT